MTKIKIPTTIDEYFDLATLADEALTMFNNASEAGLGELALRLHFQYVQLEVAIDSISKELKQQLNESEEF